MKVRKQIFHSFVVWLFMHFFSQTNVVCFFSGNILHDKAELFFHFHREFNQYIPLFEQFKTEKQTTVTTNLETTGGQQEQEMIVASSSSSSQQQHNIPSDDSSSDSDDNKEGSESTGAEATSAAQVYMEETNDETSDSMVETIYKLPEDFIKVVLLYWTKLLVSTVSSTQKRTVRTIHNVLSNLNTKKNSFVSDIIDNRVLKGDYSLVCHALSDRIACLLYRERDHLAARDSKTIHVSAFHKVMFGKRFVSRSSTLPMGPSLPSDKILSPHIFPPFFRIQLKLTFNSMSMKKMEPSWYEGKSFVAFTLEQLVEACTVLEKGTTRLRKVYQSYTANGTSSDSIDSNKYPHAKVLLATTDKSTYTFEVLKFFCKWKKEMLTTDPYWVSYNDQPTLSHKLSRVLQLTENCIELLVCINVQK